jgi:uncharacterized membrane-anchored protein
MIRSLVRQIGQQPLAAKVPEIGVMFWVVKLLTTAGGEATSDFLGHNVAIGAVVELVVVAVAVWVQFRTRRYVAAAYWFLALAIAIFGTGASDTLHLVVGIPYAGTTILWAVVLAGVFWRWHRSEGTLSIHSITTRRREVYYWATVFATFALGTALGDYTASVGNLGYLSSGILFAVIILIPALAWWGFRLNAVVAFWFAYVVTRPLGASFADYISKPQKISGANFGDGPTSTVFLIAIVILVAWLSISRNDIQAPQSAAAVPVGDPVPAAPAAETAPSAGG